jgi:hypothetical protein
VTVLADILKACLGMPTPRLVVGGAFGPLSLSMRGDDEIFREPVQLRRRLPAGEDCR